MSIRLQVGDYTYTVLLWPAETTEVLELPESDPAVAIDTETEPTVPGKEPVPALMQVCNQTLRMIHLVPAPFMVQYLAKLNADNANMVVIMHNAPFDLRVCEIRGVLEAMWIPIIEQQRLVDTGLRYMLRQLALGKILGKWALDHCAMELLKIKVEKDDEIRLDFRPNMQLTERHIRYAAIDAAITVQLYMYLREAYPTEFLQLVGAIALDDISRVGMLVDMGYMTTVKEKFEGRIREHEAIMSTFGYYVGEPGNKKVAQTILGYVEKELQYLEGDPTLKFNRTDKAKEIQSTDESLACMGLRNHPFIDTYKNFVHDNKISGTYLNKELVRWDSRVHPRFDPIKKTGRTSCKQPNIQNVPRKENIREMYLAPEGQLLYAADYSQLELCALAQSCLYWQGQSKMADLINQGVDLHTWFASVVLGKRECDVTKTERQMAKACNFGFPGGLGLPTFQHITKNNYDVYLELDRCDELRKIWKESFPEMKVHLSPPVDKGFKNKDDGGARYIGQTISGRIRRNTPYCAACNYVFQGLSADGAKLALWLLYKERYRVANFIHDETITELMHDHTTQYHCKRINTLMEYGMQQVIPDVKITVEGALMRRWHKEAEPAFDVPQGNLLIWEDIPMLQQQGTPVYDAKGVLFK